MLSSTRASGGIGRRAGFRFLCPKGREGSSPSSRTARTRAARLPPGGSPAGVEPSGTTPTTNSGVAAARR